MSNLVKYQCNKIINYKALPYQRILVQLGGAFLFQKGDNYIYIGLTHSPISQGVKNIKLNVNPNPHDSKDSYVKPKPNKDKKSTFGKREKGWRIHPSANF